RQRQADLALKRIRRARPGEAGALTELALASKASWGYPASFMARCRAALTVEPKLLRQRLFRLAEAEGGVLGFYGFEPEADGIGLSHLFIRPGSMGQGIGRALWLDAVEHARAGGHGCMIIVGDPNAAGFYLAMGATAAGARPSEVDPTRPLPLFRF